MKMNELNVKISSEAYSVPDYGTEGSAGCDLRSSEDIILGPGDRELVATGLKIAIPTGFVGMICPRSGLAFKHGITVLNAPGICDEDFRGEVKVILVNLSKKEYSIKKGDKIAQLIFTNYSRAIFEQVDDLSETARGAGGFGSTGR
jgi:dUTP pyrophosphatase